MADTPFEPRRFRSAASHYRAGRPAYAGLLIARVARFTGLNPGARVLDLGCGPGLLSEALAPSANEVIAIDPEPEMLSAVRALGIRNVRTILGSSRDLGPQLGRFRLAVMGRSFHWMDRPETLRRLDGLIEPGGGVALFGTDHPAVPENAWIEPFKRLRRQYEAGGDEMRPNRRPDWVRHEGMMLKSAFRSVEELAVIECRRVPAQSLVDRALSMSSTSPEHLGDRVDAFAAAIADAVRPYVSDGMVTEVVRSEALIGFRLGEAPS